MLKKEHGIGKFSTITFLCLVVLWFLFSSPVAFAGEPILEKINLFEHNFDQSLKNQEVFIQRDQAIELTVDSELYRPGMNVPMITPDNGFAAPITIIDETYEGTENDALKAQLQQLQRFNPMMAMVAATPSLTIVSTTATSVTLNCVFPTSGAEGNAIGVYDFNQGHTVWNHDYGNNIYRTNGNITISSLVPGGLYHVALMWSTDGGSSYGGYNTIFRRVKLPYNTAESWTRSDGNYIFTNIETADKNLASPVNFNTWLNRMDSAYLAYADLTGYAPYSKIEIRTSRTSISSDLPDGQNTWFEYLGWSGNPAYIYQPFYRSLMLRLSSGDWGDTALHEMSHDFDNWAWEFDPEFFAFLKEYYVVETLNAKVYREDMMQYFTGSSFVNFFKNHVLWGYDSAGFNTNYYNFAMGLAKIFVDIKNQVGWQPFKDTFRYFNNLPSATIPSYGANMSRFNIFTTKLRDFSGRDVNAMISSGDKAVIQSMFGGTIAYGSTPSVTTQSATVVGTTATLNGYINLNYGLPIGDYGFYYGTSSSNMNNQISLGTTTSSGFAFSRTITPTPGTYYFRVYAVNAYGTSYGQTLQFTISQPQVATPTANPAPGTYTTARNVALSCTTSGATIRYTTNGNEPTSSSTPYTSPIPVAATTTIKAKAFNANMTDSATAILTYTIAPAGTTVTMRKYEVNSNGSITKRYTEIELPITPSFSSTSSWFPSNSLFPSLPQGWLSTPLFTNINGDHRTWVSDNRITPYSAIVHLFVQLNVGDFSGDATGFMVSDRIMLSAAHNFCYYLNSEPLNVEAYPGHNAYYNVNKSTVNYTYRTDYPTAIYIPNEFCLSRNVDSDFAILVFDQSVGNSTGWFGMNTSNSPNNVTITGYPYSRTEWDENKPRGSMWTHSGPIYEIASILQKYSIDATPGQSGSPIYNSSYQASAIFVQNDQDYMPTRSIGRRITSDVVYLADYFKNNPTTSIAFSQSTYLVNNGATQVALQADLTDEYGNVINVQAQGIDVDFTLNESIVNKTGVFSTNDLLSGLNNVVATAYLANDTILETEAKIPYGAPGPTTIEFAPSAYSATIPVSGSITKAVAAQVVDQYGNTSPNCVVTYSLDQPYSGVSISSSTGVVTIQSSVEPGMVIIKAESATLPDAYSALSLSWAESIPTSVAFVQNSYSAIIPDSGSEIITVGAQVKDQYDRVMSWCSPTYSLLSAYSGVSVNSTTGAVTIQSSAAAGTVNIVASYGLLSCMAPLTFNMSNSAYTMVFYNNNNSEPCYYDDNEGSYYYYIDVNSTDTINLCAYVLDSEGEIVTWPELISVEYVSDSEVMNTTGEFTLEELGIHAWGWYPSVTYVTVTAILSDSTVLQGLARVEATAIQPRR